MVYSKGWKKKHYQPGILYLVKLAYKNEGEIITFTDKQKLREYITTRPVWQEMLKWSLKLKWKDTKHNMKAYKGKNLIGKGEYTDKYRIL